MRAIGFFSLLTSGKGLGIILIGLLVLPSFIAYPFEAEEERPYWARLWKSMSEKDREWYLLGFRDGFVQGGFDYSIYYDRYIKIPAEDRKSYEGGSIGRPFPYPSELSDLVTEFYGDPANAYVDWKVLILISLAKLKGASDHAINRMLIAGRKGGMTGLADVYKLIQKEFYMREEE